LDNQLFRKTYVAAKKEVDEWLRAPSYEKGKGAEDEAVPLGKAVDRDENEFLAQLKLSSTGQVPEADQATKTESSGLLSEVISVAQYRQRHSVKTLTREFIKKIKNPDLNLDGSPKAGVQKKASHHARNPNSLHYDQNDPFSVAKAQIS